MAIMRSVNHDGYLEQTAPIQTLPDSSGDITVFFWVINLMPAVVLPDYKTPFILLTDVDLSSPYLAVNIVQSGGQQSYELRSDASSSVPWPSAMQYVAVAVRCNATSHLCELLTRTVLAGDATWSVVGTITQDFTGAPFETMRGLGDALGAVYGLAVTFIRHWSALLDTDALELEANSAVAIRRDGLVMDTPLQELIDLTDVSGNGNDWSEP